MALQVWLPLNGNLNNQGLTNVTVTNGGTTVDNNGKIGKCYAFNGSSKITNTLPTPIDSSIGTLACWFKMTSLPSSSGFYNLMQLGNLGGYATCRFGVYMEYTNRINISIDGSDLNTNAYTHSLVANQWYHLCVTHDGTTVKLYIDGVEVLSKASTKGSYKTTASYLYVGGTSSWWLKGSMNDVRYYSTALPPKEIEILSRGLVCHYPLSDSAIEATTNLVTNLTAGTRTTKSADGTSIITNGENADTYFYINTSEAITTNTIYTFSCYVTGASGDSKYAYKINNESSLAFYLKNGYNEYTFSATSSMNNKTQILIDDGTRPETVTSITITNIQLEKKDHATLYAGLGGTRSGDTTVYDTSGYQYNGTVNGTITVSDDTARYSKSTEFSKTGHITNSSFGLTTNAFTVNFWVKLKTAASQHFVLGTFNSWTGNGFGLYREANGTTYQSLIRSTAESTYKQHTMALTGGVWQMLTYVYTGTHYMGYLNGVLKFDDTYGLNGNVSHPVLVLANSYYNGTPASENEEAFLSDFRFYATALSATQVAELYNTAVSVANNGTLMGYELVEV